MFSITEPGPSQFTIVFHKAYATLGTSVTHINVVRLYQPLVSRSLSEAYDDATASHAKRVGFLA